MNSNKPPKLVSPMPISAEDTATDHEPFVEFVAKFKMQST
jgi:hypothetical protein